MLRLLSRLGLRVNWEKIKLSPMQRISFLGMELDLVDMTAHLTNECAQSVVNCLNLFRGRTAVPLKPFKRLRGHMVSARIASYETASALAPQSGTHGNHSDLSLYFQPVVGWTLFFYRHVEQLCQQMPPARVGMLNAMDTQPRVSGQDLNCSDISIASSCRTVGRFLPLLRGKHLLVRTDNTSICVSIAYINCQGGLHSHRV